jgi:N-methylhydantoinase A/oxoprolinase/acetone carboxylase beta subunit
MMSYRVRVRVAVPKFDLRFRPDDGQAVKPTAIRTAEIRLVDGPPISVPVYARGSLSTGQAVAGPAIVRQLDATTLLPPGWTARVDGHRNLILEAGSG